MRAPLLPFLPFIREILHLYTDAPSLVNKEYTGNNNEHYLCHNIIVFFSFTVVSDYSFVCFGCSVILSASV